MLLSVMVALMVLGVMPDGIAGLNTNVEVQAATTVGTPKLVSAKATGTASAKVYWERVSGASGYRIYRKTDGTNWKAIKTISGNRTSSYADSKLEAGTRYFYTVRAYKKVQGKTVWGKYNARGVYTVTGLEMPLFVVEYKNAERNVIDISIGKCKGPTGFIIYRKEKESDNWKQIGTITKGSTRSTHYIDKNVNPDINYIYTVKGYCTYGGKKYYSSYYKMGRRCYEGSGFSYLEYNINKGTVMDVKQYAYDNRNIVWESENERIATIDSKGILRGVNFGKTEIKATVDGKTYTSKVNVNRTIEVDKSDIVCSKPIDITVYLCIEEKGLPTYNIEDTSVLSCTWGEGHYDKTEYGWCRYWKLTINPRANGSTKIRLTNNINNEETILNVTVTGIKKDAGFTKLKSYITSHGYTNNKGNKFIKASRTVGSLTYDWAIIYDSSQKKFQFLLLGNDSKTSCSEGLSMYISENDLAHAYAEATYAYTDIGEGVATNTTFNTANYIKNSNIQFNITECTNSVLRANANKISNELLQLACQGWEVMLLEPYVGITLRDIGFTSY